MDSNRSIYEHLISTGILFFAFLTLRWVGIRALRQARFSNQDVRRRWIVQYKNSLFVLLVIGMTVIWGSQLRSFALGLVAIAVAIVVATKEMILCFLGGLLKASTGPFDVGDNIEIGQARGQVIDHNFVTTTLLEMGPGTYLQQYTGRTVIVPNSLFLTQPIYNFTASGRYVLHVFIIPAKPPVDWRKMEKCLLDSAEEECAAFIGEARSYMAAMGHKEGIDVPSADPRVSIHLTEPERWDFIVRVPAPSARRSRVEQGILKRYLEKMSHV